VGGGLAGLSTAVELLDQGHEVDIYEGRQWVGGKVASFKDKDGNHIEVRALRWGWGVGALGVGVGALRAAGGVCCWECGACRIELVCVATSHRKKSGGLLDDVNKIGQNPKLNDLTPCGKPSYLIVPADSNPCPLKPPFLE